MAQGIFKGLINDLFYPDFPDYKVVNPIPETDVNNILNAFKKGYFSEREETESTKFLGNGCYGYAHMYVGQDGSKYKVKVPRNAYKLSDARKLEKLQGSPYYPKLYFYIKDALMVTEYIEGKTGDKYFQGKDSHLNRMLPENFLDMFQDSLNFSLSRKITPYDVHSENFIIEERTLRPVIIDVGEFTDYHDNPEYMTELEEKGKFEPNNEYSKSIVNDIKWKYDNLTKKKSEKEKEEKKVVPARMFDGGFIRDNNEAGDAIPFLRVAEVADGLPSFVRL